VTFKFARLSKPSLSPSLVSLAAVLGLGLPAVSQHLISRAEAQPADPMVPYFEADPYWPRPLPNHWRLGQTIGVSIDSHDDVWIVHRPGSLERMESYSTRGEADCCTAAPDVVEFDPAGNVINSFGRVEGHDWPTSNHGIFIDKQGNVWLGANGQEQPEPYAPGSAEQFPRRGMGGPPPAAYAEGAAARGAYHDDFILKLSHDGKFLGEIGKANASKGSLDTQNVKGVAMVRMIPGTNELVAADGYGNHRVAVFDATTLKFKRMWGAYGKPPTDDSVPHYDVNSPQFGNPVHCAEPSNDGLIYVCDRTNNRLQVFKDNGTYVKQYTLEPDTKGDGSIWEIAFSRDPKQRFAYISDGANEKVHVFDRQTMKELYAFGGGGRQPGEFYALHSLVTNSKGDIFTTETYRGQRVQKFTYKGMIPLSKLMQMKFVGNAEIYAPE
jgi:NHL repeat